jgi:hypothetical protein
VRRLKKRKLLLRDRIHVLQAAVDEVRHEHKLGMRASFTRAFLHARTHAKRE